MRELIEFSIDGKLFNCPLTPPAEFMVRSVPKPYQVMWDDSANPFDKINQVVQENSKNLLLIDEKIIHYYGHHLNISSERILKVPALETFKTMEGLTQVLNFLHQHNFTKGETLVVVGGGIIQDVGAFAGACYKRGIRWLHFPTTLLAMCDSCIGGKSSINFQQAKNQIALFSTPYEVIINPQFLKTLPDDAIQSGMGEILKLCITGGPEFIRLYQRCVNQGKVVDEKYYKELILGALSIKRAIVEEDEFELNHRRALNYGHTFGHAIEVLTDYQIPHGTAVVIGMMLVNELSYREGLLSRAEKVDINNLSRELLYEKTLSLLREINLMQMLDLLKKDKKAVGSEVSFVMIKTPGVVQFVKRQMNEELLQQVDIALKQVCPMVPIVP